MTRIASTTLVLAALLAGCDGGSKAQSAGQARLRCPPCPATSVCVDDASDACDSTMADCPGICVTPVFCGGIAAIPCPPGQTCVDDPRDDCMPPSGADCGGLCAPARSEADANTVYAPELAAYAR